MLLAKAVVSLVVTAAQSLTMPTEDYPGPSKSHPEKEDTNDPPRPANVDPEEPPLPDQEEAPSQEEE